MTGRQAHREEETWRSHPGSPADCQQACLQSGEEPEGRALRAGRAPGSQPASPEHIHPPTSSVPHPHTTTQAKCMLPVQPAKGSAANHRSILPAPSRAKQAGGGSAHAEGMPAAAVLPDPPLPRRIPWQFLG